jgi:hypothetical protein
MTAKKYFDFVKKFFFPLLAVSVIFVLSSVFWTTESVFSYTELSDVKFGFPTAFVSKNMTGQYDFNDFSHMTRYVLPMEITFGPGIEKIMQLGILIIPLVVSYVYSIIVEVTTAGGISFFPVSGIIFSWHLFFLNIVIVQFALATTLFFAFTLFLNTQKFPKFSTVKNTLIGFVFLILIICGYIFLSLLSSEKTRVQTPQELYPRPQAQAIP